MQKDFIVEFTAYNSKNVAIQSGKAKAIQKFNSFDAKVLLEKKLKEELPEFHRLVVHDCKEQSFPDFFSSFFGVVYKHTY